MSDDSNQGETSPPRDWSHEATAQAWLLPTAGKHMLKALRSHLCSGGSLPSAQWPRKISIFAGTASQPRLEDSSISWPDPPGGECRIPPRLMNSPEPRLCKFNISSLVGSSCPNLERLVVTCPRGVLEARMRLGDGGAQRRLHDS